MTQSLIFHYVIVVILSLVVVMSQEMASFTHSTRALKYGIVTHPWMKDHTRHAQDHHLVKIMDAPMACSTIGLSMIILIITACKSVSPVSKSYISDIIMIDMDNTRVIFI